MSAVHSGWGPPDIPLLVSVAFVIKCELPHVVLTETQIHAYTHIHSLSTRVRHMYLWMMGEGVETLLFSRVVKKRAVKTAIKQMFPFILFVLFLLIS